MQKRKIAVLGMILIMLITGGLFSEKGRIKGNVKDEQGQPVEKAKVKPEPKEDQVSDTTEVETDAEGDFTTESLENGLYGLSVTKEGYLQKLKDITLNFSVFSNGEGFNCSNNIDIDVVLEKEETPSTTNISAKLIITASPFSIYADGVSTSLITAKICDDSNLLVTTATNQVAFSISGTGTLLGTTVKSASAGIATVIMQSTTTAGTATVTATASNLIQGIVNIVTAAIPSGMVLIPAGNFNMGSTSGQPSEQPVHAVYLDAYYIDKYEVTNGVYKVFMDSGGYNNSAYWTTDGWTWKTNNSITQPYYWNDSTFGYNATNGPSLPVVGVSWYVVYAYANWAGKRLPTEAEWEKACRAGSDTQYCFGDDISKLDEYAWHSSNSSNKTHPIGEKNPNAWGIYDMHGNVWEWCSDWYDENYYQNSPKKNPTGPAAGTYRVLRGGSWDFLANGYRSAVRYGYSPDDYWSRDVGFRCASGAVQ